MICWLLLPKVVLYDEQWESDCAYWLLGLMVCWMLLPAARFLILHSWYIRYTRNEWIKFAVMYIRQARWFTFWLGHVPFHAVPEQYGQL